MLAIGPKPSISHVREAWSQFALGPAGQMELPAAVAAIGAERQAGLLQRQQRLGLGRKAALPGADAQPGTQASLLIFELDQIDVLARAMLRHAHQIGNVREA